MPIPFLEVERMNVGDERAYRQGATVSRAFGDKTQVETPNREDSGQYRRAQEGQAEKPDRLLGAVLDGRYRLEKRLARGAMGCVYLARQAPLDRPVAVKVLDPKGESDDPEVFGERFLLEASTLARLQHPNTVRVFDYGEWRGHTCLVMEYVDGYSLQRLQAGGPVPAQRVLHIATQICDALQEAHALGLIHRDLKPANILLTRHAGALDVVKVVDFGLAKDFYGKTEITQAGQVLGTPMYMAPEQIRDEACDQRTDIYALGVLLYRALTGVIPFEKGPAMKVLMAHLKENAPAFAEANPELRLPAVIEWTVARCLEKDPSARFASVVELRKALHACRLAIENPELADVALRLEDGRVVLPDVFVETASTGLAWRPVQVASELSDEPAAGLDRALPLRAVLAAAALFGLGALAAGAVLGQLLS